MIKKIASWTLVLAFAAALFGGFDSCSASYVLESTDEFSVGYSMKDAFISAVFWDGETDLSFTVPDEYAGRRITALGGYTGTGVPCPFRAYPNGKAYDWCSVGDRDDCDGCDTAVISVTLGKNVTKLRCVDGKCYYGSTVEDGEGGYRDVPSIKVVYRFTADESNPVFYSENGRLYYKDGGTLVDEFFYE